MSNTGSIAKPISRREIRRFACEIRKSLGLENIAYFPIMEFLELILPKIMPGFELEILSQEEMGELHGKTCPADKKIYLRQDVYDRACEGQGRDRFTVAHELGHLFYHVPQNIVLARSNCEVRICENPEWQANTFAGELLVPFNFAGSKTETEIMTACGVSYSAARCQKNIKH